MASHWAARDWSFPSVGRMKQGQDVKALVMISPEKQIKGVAIDPVLKDPNLLNLPILIVRGKTKSASEGNPSHCQTHRRLEKEGRRRDGIRVPTANH